MNLNFGGVVGALIGMFLAISLSMGSAGSSQPGASSGLFLGGEVAGGAIVNFPCSGIRGK